MRSKLRAGTIGVLAALMLWVGVAPTARAQETAADDTLQVVEVQKRGWLAFTEVVGINVGIWTFNRYLREGGTNPGFRIGTNSWNENIHNGWEWDDNSFNTNQFAHPFHGNLYFNAARSNGYGYWGSLVYSMGGSWMWEYMMETHHPSYNDWIATGYGGAALGEALHRLSGMVVDNTATGSGRVWREIGGFFLNPVGGFNRLVTGQASRVSANPPDRRPIFFGSSVEAGLRTIGEDRVWESDTTRVYIRVSVQHGDPFAGDRKKPFDSFDFNVQMNFGDKSGIGMANAKGLLFATPISDEENSQQLIAAYQHYDYINTNAFELGGQSISASYLSKIKTGQSTLVTQLHADGVILGASKSDYEDFSGRSYGYGPGIGFKFNTTLYRRGKPFFILGHSSHWIFVMSGDSATHNVNLSFVRMHIPLADFFGLGVEYDLYYAQRNYRDFGNVYQRNPELRVFMNWLAD